MNQHIIIIIIIIIIVVVIIIINNNNNTGVYLLRSLHRNEGDRVANKLQPEVHCKIN